MALGLPGAWACLSQAGPRSSFGLWPLHPTLPLQGPQHIRWPPSPVSLSEGLVQYAMYSTSTMAQPRIGLGGLPGVRWAGITVPKGLPKAHLGSPGLSGSKGVVQKCPKGPRIWLDFGTLKSEVPKGAQMVPPGRFILGLFWAFLGPKGLKARRSWSPPFRAPGGPFDPEWYPKRALLALPRAFLGLLLGLFKASGPLLEGPLGPYLALGCQGGPDPATALRGSRS
jgi:hypothetical protein